MYNIRTVHYGTSTVYSYKYTVQVYMSINKRIEVKGLVNLYSYLVNSKNN